MKICMEGTTSVLLEWSGMREKDSVALLSVRTKSGMTLTTPVLLVSMTGEEKEEEDEDEV